MPRGGARTPNIAERHIKLRLFTPHEGQLRLAQDPARFRCVACGRRWGKTFFAANALAKYGWENSEYPGWWTAPTYGQAVKGFELITSNFGPAIKSKRASQGQMSVTFHSGGRLRFVSTERYENLRGEGVGFMVLDEAAFMARDAWEQVLRPMLSDTGGRALFLSTPKGRNWFYEVWMRGWNHDDPDYSSYHYPTSSSPYIPAREVEEARRTLPADVFAQEYEAEFLSEAAGVFHNVRGCIYDTNEDTGWPFPDTPQKGHRYVHGWDVAKHTDFSVITTIDTDAQPKPRVVDWTRFNDIRYDTQMDMLARVVGKWGGYVLMDTTGLGDPIYDSLIGRGVPVVGYHFTSSTKQQIIQNLAVDLQHGDIQYPDIPVLVNELETYAYEIGPTGNIRYSAPEGMHDDCVISLALADWANRHPVWNQNAILSVSDDDWSISPI